MILITGQNVQIGTNIGPGGTINAAGFNIFDNLIYARVQVSGSGSTLKSQVIRIGAGGSYTILSTFLDGAWNSSVVDV